MLGLIKNKKVTICHVKSQTILNELASGRGVYAIHLLFVVLTVVLTVVKSIQVMNLTYQHCTM